ncbi:hypothetical protein K443DRAFT_671806 [Laccaria amethystina LaAM-08-1]|uniref:Uncharacterized protein n=1 Tax=Laccaria amethystina LaAM-08-1 TaxID=1095629 RepID=A0A0C9YFW4_9AGAR|nr:hypothetical protein K443DRAFT_671806 [Laccaria amethystina LaAM-08-1]
MSALSLTIAILVADKVYAKGGGGHASSHSSSSSKSSSKSSSSKSSSSKSGSSKTTSGGSGHSVIIVGSGSDAQCHDSVTNQIVRCPINSRRNIIIIVVVFSILGAVFVGVAAWQCIRRRQRNQRQLENKIVVLPFEASLKKEYQRLEDPV